jgi:hypothetical protein
MKDDHVFIKSIIYCPTQIYYCFTDEEGQRWVLYVHQRGGPLTCDLINVREDGEWGNWNKVVLSREYDINGKQSQSEEESEIMAVEEEMLWFLRQRFPKVIFPDHPKRKNKV